MWSRILRDLTVDGEHVRVIVSWNRGDDWRACPDASIDVTAGDGSWWVTVPQAPLVSEIREISREMQGPLTKWRMR